MFHMGVNLGLSNEGKKYMAGGVGELGAGGRHLGLRGTREQGNGENYIMRSFVICIAD
jgi:hypothetical protein